MASKLKQLVKHLFESIDVDEVDPKVLQRLSRLPERRRKIELERMRRQRMRDLRKTRSEYPRLAALLRQRDAIDQRIKAERERIKRMKEQGR